jgi:Ca2+-binding RTX toxin-like protein
MPNRPARRSATLLALSLGIPILVGAPARAGSDSCSFSGATVTVTAVGVTPSDLVRNGDEIWFNGQPCQDPSATRTATVTTVDTVVATVDGPQLDIDLGGGPFAPGLTDEGDGSSEIEFQATVDPVDHGSVAVLGSSGSDHLTAATDTGNGDTLVNLNADEPSGDDADLSIGGAPSFLVVQGRGGDDVISFETDPAWSDANLAIDAIAGGNGGADTVGCALNGSQLNGGPGNDTLACSWPPGGIVASLARGTVRDRSGSPVDALAGFDGVLGSAANDSIVGNDDRNTLEGQGGDDVLSGGRGDDRLMGRGGDDSLYGGADNDHLNGGSGTNLCRGGPGTNVYRYC